ncbi:hypothetical protein JHU38_02960 [Prevotella sp. A2931]|uniref:Phosphoenolpyruvate carboxykinase n=2 Tax=Prevotellaceae TaxID=171552 RepID=A0ABS3M3U2_9BACT|nr:hypothetical protein [Prevotella sp. oral taxon 820]MBO1362746.1 hypothetical protein [Prevotella illustrans]PTL25741.1 hypothetical protein C3V39_00805 [Prevotella sp. oral taxon 820]
MNYFFKIAEHYIKLDFGQEAIPGKHFLFPFMPFTTTPVNTERLLFNILFTNNLSPFPDESVNRIRTVDTGSCIIIVEQRHEGGYQFKISNLQGQKCCLLHTNKSFSQCQCMLYGNFINQKLGFNNALMLTYAFAGSLHETLLIHAALVRHDQKGYAFIANSGTGKSTQANNWIQNIPNCDLMNDDNPILRVIDGTVYAFGSPWSGKTPCYRQVKAKLGAIIRIDRATRNTIEQVKPIEAFISLLNACSSMKWDKEIYEKICETIKLITESVPHYTLHCLPDKESALLCSKTVAKQK